MRLIAPTITLFITNVHVMVDGYSERIVQKQPPAAQCHTAVTSHRTDFILHNTLKFRQFTYTAALFTVTASDGTDRTQNKIYSTAAFHFTDRQCTVESTVDIV